MNSRQRFASAMRHQASDRPPIDIGATTPTSMAVGCRRSLRQALGFGGEVQSAWSFGVDERLLDWAGTDFRAVGGIVELMDPLIACGVDILNPVQTSAAGMEPGRLKRSFGERRVFWGGVDVQQFLRVSTPEQVREGVVEPIGIFGRNGGYVIASAHNRQDGIPPGNIIARVEALRDPSRRPSVSKTAAISDADVQPNQ